eukprot:gb/GECG01014705.1/.p1 GENE.gb/GECG01014705.1/~~gb/GECG01014705.1/.p1  ORF type:complete len:300 (+),score=27.99 gb/GECG01014705.1/:1-900(+)
MADRRSVLFNAAIVLCMLTCSQVTCAEMADQDTESNGHSSNQVLTPAEKKAKKLREIRERQERQQRELNSGPTLALPGRKFNFDWSGGEFTIHGSPLFIQQRENTGIGTGLTIWDGAVLLAKYLEHRYHSVLSGRRVLELGAGTGIVGLAASALGAKQTLITDLDYALDNLESNIAKNKGLLKGEVSSLELDWSKPFPIPGIDVILAADVVWVEELIRPLVNTLVVLTNEAVEIGFDGEDSKHVDHEWCESVTGVSGIGPLILLSHQTRTRSADNLLFDLLSEHFNIKEVCIHPAFYSI